MYLTVSGRARFACGMPGQHLTVAWLNLEYMENQGVRICHPPRPHTKLHSDVDSTFLCYMLLPGAQSLESSCLSELLSNSGCYVIESSNFVVLITYPQSTGDELSNDVFRFTFKYIYR